MNIRKEQIICALLSGCMFGLGYLIAPETVETEPDVKYIQVTDQDDLNVMKKVYERLEQEYKITDKDRLEKLSKKELITKIENKNSDIEYSLKQLKIKLDEYHYLND